MRIRALARTLAVAALFFIAAFIVHARADLMSYVSDLITTSAPSTGADHRVQFTTVSAIPPSGTITITLQDGVFSIPASFDYTDVDFSVWNGVAYVDRTLAASQSAGADGVSVVTGTSGSITITLSSSLGIPANSQVQIRLGTNATVGAQGSDQITNPSAQGSYHLYFDTASDTGVAIDTASTLIAVVLPVTLNLPLQNTPPGRFNGLPSGLLAAGNSTIEITFETDRTARCRYSTTPNTPYASMTDSFAPNQGIFFYTVISGFQNNTTYTYYVRCIGLQGAINQDDYPITFSLDATPMSDTSVTQSGGVIGSGNFANGSNVLYLSTLSLSGFASPGSTIVLLKDGTQLLTSQSGGDGAFHAVVPGLNRGVYTITVYAIDPSGRKSASYTSILNVAAGTDNQITGITVPPSMSAEKNPVGIGEKVVVSGSSVPGSTVDVSVIPHEEANGAIKYYYASTTSSGSWSISIPGSDLGQGTYSLRARATLSTAQSDYGGPLYLGVGQVANPGVVGKTDINSDGKVNLIDFSILLSFWGTSNPAGDLNGDGTVNLADFSILLFNWTG